MAFTPSVKPHIPYIDRTQTFLDLDFNTAYAAHNAYFIKAIHFIPFTFFIETCIHSQSCCCISSLSQKCCR